MNQSNNATDLLKKIQSLNQSNSGPTSNIYLSIVGVKNLGDKDLSLYRKLIWLLCLVSCCSTVAYYVTSRVQYILSLPTQVAVTLKQNASLQLPDVVLCPNTPFNPDKLEEIGMTADGLPTSDFAYEGSFNVTDLWDEISTTSKFISTTSVNLQNSKKNWRPTYTTMGVCYRHHYDEPIRASGLSFGMSVKINWNEVYFSRVLSEREGLKMFFNSPNDQPLTEVEGINVAPREDISIAIRIKEFKSLSRQSHPCVKELAYSRSRCVNECFNANLLSLTNCRLPFMESIMSNDNSEIVDNWCEPQDKYQSGFRTFWRKAKSNLTLWAECGQLCLIECDKLVYTPYIESVSVADSSYIGKFVIYFPEMWYEIVEEKEAYDIIAFLCDIGGTFGLFLGCSLLTLVEIIEFITLYFYYK